MQATPAETLMVINQCKTTNMMRVATLDDGSLWCMVSAIMLTQLQVRITEVSEMNGSCI
jgi:hypothetical protein